MFLGALTLPPAHNNHASNACGGRTQVIDRIVTMIRDLRAKPLMHGSDQLGVVGSIGQLRAVREGAYSTQILVAPPLRSLRPSIASLCRLGVMTFARSNR